MRKYLQGLTLIIAFFPFSIVLSHYPGAVSPIQPYKENKRYWEYKGSPVLLLGATNNDNLFQSTDVLDELDNLVKVGGNYVRNVMSSRDKGDEQPFKQMDSGKYDLNQWNVSYWERFESFLNETYKRDIIVQIEIWDPHDIYGNRWNKNAWNPALNINYSESNCLLKETYGEDAMIEKQDFFFSVPLLDYDLLVLYYQNRFVEKLLEISLKFPHVLYCITNEIHPNTSPEWGVYWAKFIKAKASAMSKRVYVTEMYWDPEMRGMQHRTVLENFSIFDYFEASQNSSSVHGRLNWEKSVWLLDFMKREGLRPVNHVKIYGNMLPPDGAEDHDALARFWRNILAGAASSRFHRPGGGVGLNTRTAQHIKSARMLVSEFPVFQAEPDANYSWISGNENNEAFVSTYRDSIFAVYFPYGGEVNLLNHSGIREYSIRWLDIDKSSWSPIKHIRNRESIELKTPGKGHYLALIKKE